MKAVRSLLVDTQEGHALYVEVESDGLISAPGPTVSVRLQHEHYLTPPEARMLAHQLLGAADIAERAQRAATEQWQKDHGSASRPRRE